MFGHRRAARLLTLHAAWVIDRDGAAAARDEISAIKFVVVTTMLRAVDWAIQVHGAAGVTQFTPLAEMYASMRTLRIADGPDDVHLEAIAKQEIAEQLRGCADR